MAGIAIGAIFLGKFIHSGGKSVALIFFVSGLVLPGMIILLQEYNSLLHSTLNSILIYSIIFLAGCITGLLFFNGALFLRKKSTSERSASGLYGADLIGAATGIFIVSVYLVPFRGIIETCIILAILNILYAAYIVLFKGLKGYLS
jgi:hypothetical protein